METPAVIKDQYNGLGHQIIEPGKQTVELTDKIHRTLRPKCVVFTMTTEDGESLPVSHLERVDFDVERVGGKRLWSETCYRPTQSDLRGPSGPTLPLAPTWLKPGMTVILKLTFQDPVPEEVTVSGGIICDEKNPFPLPFLHCVYAQSDR